MVVLEARIPRDAEVLVLVYESINLGRLHVCLKWMLMRYFVHAAHRLLRLATLLLFLFLLWKLIAEEYLLLVLQKLEQALLLLLAKIWRCLDQVNVHILQVARELLESLQKYQIISVSELSGTYAKHIAHHDASAGPYLDQVDRLQCLRHG